MNSSKTTDKHEPREIRRKLGLNQQQFWSKIGVTQSGGSRYESGRNMPRPVRELLRLVHVEQIDIQRVKREDMDVIDYLKSAEGWRLAAHHASPGRSEVVEVTQPGQLLH